MGILADAARIAKPACSRVCRSRRRREVPGRPASGPARCAARGMPGCPTDRGGAAVPGSAADQSPAVSKSPRGSGHCRILESRGRRDRAVRTRRRCPDRRCSNQADSSARIAIHGQIVIGHESRALHRRQHGYAGDDPAAPSKLPPCGTLSRCEPMTTRGALRSSSGQRHRQVTDWVDGDFEPCGVGRRPGDVVRRLLAVAVAVAHDAPAAARGTAQGLKQRRSQVEIGLDAPAMGISSRARCSRGSKPMSSLLAGKIAVVTGASSGHRSRDCHRLRQRRGECRHCGYHRAARRRRGLDARYHYPSGGRALFQKTDVGRWDDVDALIGATVERHGRLDVHGEQRRYLFRRRVAADRTRAMGAGHAGQSDGHIQRLQAARSSR